MGNVKLEDYRGGAFVDFGEFLRIWKVEWKNKTCICTVLNF